MTPHFQPKATAVLRACTGFKGEYKFVKLDADRNVVYESEWIPNLITDIGMDRIATAAVGTFCRIGTGTTTPAFTDTQLVSQSASSSNIVSSSTTTAGSPNYERQRTDTYEFALGAVVGNMAEVGVGWAASTASTLFSRALILDGVGSPTTLTVLSTEILQVIYRMTAYPQITDTTGTVVISGTTYNFTARWADITVTNMALSTQAPMISTVSSPNAYTGAIGAITGAPSGTVAGLTAGSLQAYTNGTHYRDYTITAAIGVGNLAGGIKSIRTYLAGGAGDFSRTQVEFSPNLPKTSSNVLSLTMRQAWARH